MPRISPRMIREAWAHSRMAVPLLKATRDVSLAKSELKWIQNELLPSKWADAIARRSRLEPLQYILGTQPFGPLDILCAQNVLIPRWETEEWVTSTAKALPQSLTVTILDACTGSGCIPLLLKAMLAQADVHAFDFSKDALDLSFRNKEQTRLDVDFWKDDVFDFKKAAKLTSVDLVTSNPPYIPLHDYKKPLALDGPEMSVRLYEPQEALVGHLEFYTALVKNLVVPLQAKGLVFELGYEDQAVETARNLPHTWSCGRYFDSNGKLRCVVAWERKSQMQGLRVMVNGGFLK